MTSQTQSRQELQNPARTITRLSRLITRHFDRKFAELGVNVAYLSVLGPLAATSSMPQKDLAATAGASQPAMAELLARMVKDGLIERIRDPADKRQVLFSLSAKGKELMPQVANIIAEENAEIFSVLGDDGLKSLVSLLGRLEVRMEEL